MNKEIYIFDIQLFPSINYSIALFGKTNIVFEQYEHYLKTGFANRYRIATPDGVLKLSVPLSGGRDKKQVLKDVRIDPKSDWQKQHWRAIVSSYNRSPFFEYYAPDLESLYEKRYQFLLDLQLDSIEFLAKSFRKKINFRLTEAYEKLLPSSTEDLRHAFDKVEMAHPKYPQVFEERVGFLPNLSALDALFNAGPACF